MPVPQTHTPRSARTLGHRPAHGRAEVGVVDRDVGDAGARDRLTSWPCAGDMLGQDLLQVEPGMIRADGDRAWT